MSQSHHIVVLGLGIAGSSIAATLAEGGYRVTAIEQFSPLHERGSSHGDTRIYRRAPFEGDVYVEMARVSFEGWREWSRAAGEDLFVQCGGIDAGPPGNPLSVNAARLCAYYKLPHEILSGAAINERYPHYHLPPSWQVVYQPMSGFVRPDAARKFLHKMARLAGARMLFETPVTAIETGADGIRVRAGTETIAGDQLIVAAGSWLPQLFPELKLSLAVERRVLGWYAPQTPEPLADGRLPIFCMDADGGWYGMPTPNGRLKIGHDKHLGESVDPNSLPVAAGQADAAILSPCITRYFQGFSNEPETMKPCIYTLTDDHHFIIDRHPMHERIVLFSCCSGHGFKYGPAYGQIALDLVAGRPREDLAALRLGRNDGRVTTFG
jgi:sarcosine oxidase